MFRKRQLRPLLAPQDDEDVVSIALEDIVVGEEYEGVINNVVTYGAFVDIGTEVRTSQYDVMQFVACARGT